jgi:uncharacterized membrane protein
MVFPVAVIITIMVLEQELPHEDGAAGMYAVLFCTFPRHKGLSFIIDRAARMRPQATISI